MKKRNIPLSVIILFSFILCNSTYAEYNIEYQIENALETFEKDMDTRFSRASFESLHRKYNDLKINYIIEKYKHPEKYKGDFKKFFQNNFSSWLRDTNLIMNVKEWKNYTKTNKVLQSYKVNKSAYIDFLGQIKKEDELFKIMPYEDIIKIQIYSNFVIVSGGLKFFLIAEDETYIWPFCKKKKKKE